MRGPKAKVGPGPDFFENWRGVLAGCKVLYAYEYPLYSDAYIGGELSVGPYQFINTIAHIGSSGATAVAPVLVLKVDVHIDPDWPEMDATDTRRYHGGLLSDEVAALAALDMGVRVKAGPVTRVFNGGDERGRPFAYGYEIPTLLQGKFGRTLPPAADGRTLDLAWLKFPSDADIEDEIALIRAARLYQDAIWIADSEPALSWLLLVSAVETAAGRWNMSASSKTDRLRYSKPKLVEEIESRCPELLAVVADEIADTLRSTQKFVSFVLTFLPPPPRVRPEPASQLTWTEKELKPLLLKIYDYRSKALHTGVPFPAPMCQHPTRVNANSTVHEERFSASAVSILDSVWVREDLPMALHIFEYIVREVLKSWWSAL